MLRHYHFLLLQHSGVHKSVTKPKNVCLIGIRAPLVPLSFTVQPLDFLPHLSGVKQDSWEGFPPLILMTVDPC